MNFICLSDYGLFCLETKLYSNIFNGFMQYNVFDRTFSIYFNKREWQKIWRKEEDFQCEILKRLNEKMECSERCQASILYLKKCENFNFSVYVDGDYNDDSGDA